EAGRHADRMPAPQPRGLDLPEAAFGLYDTILVLDHATGEAVLRSIGGPARLARFAERLSGPAEPPAVDWRPVGRWTAETDGPAYRAGVAAIRALIAAGDIYQANLTLRHLARMPKGLTPLMLYRRLRALSPAPFAAFLDLGGGRWIASAS